ncbi:hypothetical protein PUN28_009738 [Cardiocondyla obscurior]|uniref:Uncharacterized protein n=1 Tax=Cardiocondyla obscurior TaxID=286306 RepID=A0AAW2FMS8_9HYME
MRNITKQDEDAETSESDFQSSDSDENTSAVNSPLSVSIQSPGNKVHKTGTIRKQTRNKRQILQNHEMDSDDINSDENNNGTLKTKKRSTFPFGITKRTRWIKKERNTIFKVFQKEISIKQLPSNMKIFYVKVLCCGENRRTLQIRK